MSKIEATARGDAQTAGKTAQTNIGDARLVPMTLDEMADICVLLRLVELVDPYAHSEAFLPDAAAWRKRLIDRWAEGGAA